MDEVQRTAFLRMMMTGAMNDVRGQLAAFRDLGALDPDADLDELIRLLKIDQPVRDATKMSGEEIASEIQQILKVLLKTGARLPKPLMLYAKDMLFFDGAVAELAPDLNIFEEVARIYAYFVQHHGPTIAAQIGFDPGQTSLDLTGMKASLGLKDDVESLTHRELQERRRTIARKLEQSGIGLPRIDPTD
jgi:ubiquinone biosynthesis protein